MRTRRPGQRPHARLLPTLFDRLRDDAPQRTEEAAGSFTATRAQMRDIVQRDLGYLLNTTNRADEIDAERYPQVAASVLNYGVPSVTGAYLSEQRWSTLVAVMRRAITDFEPRLDPDALQILPLHKNDAAHHYNVLVFEIRGFIRMDPYPMAFTAHTRLDLETHQMNVRFVEGA
jgi:type VI secretion system protein ImpF